MRLQDARAISKILRSKGLRASLVNSRAACLEHDPKMHVMCGTSAVLLEWNKPGDPEPRYIWTREEATRA